MIRRIVIEVQTSDDGRFCDRACEHYDAEMARCLAFDVPLRDEGGLRYQYQPGVKLERDPECVLADANLAELLGETDT